MLDSGFSHLSSHYFLAPARSIHPVAHPDCLATAFTKTPVLPNPPILLVNLASSELPDFSNFREVIGPPSGGLSSNVCFLHTYLSNLSINTVCATFSYFLFGSSQRWTTWKQTNQNPAHIAYILSNTSLTNQFTLFINPLKSTFKAQWLFQRYLGKYLLDRQKETRRLMAQTVALGPSLEPLTETYLVSRLCLCNILKNLRHPVMYLLMRKIRECQVRKENDKLSKVTVLCVSFAGDVSKSFRY